MVGKKIVEQMEAAVGNTKFHTENLYRSTVDTVEHVVDYTSATFLKTYAGIVGTYQALKYAGLSIAMVTAPVPTLIALAILWLMELSIDSVKNDIDTELKNKERKREFERVVKMLKKYGKIPQTAVVETELVRMDIDSVTGSVDGVIHAGHFKAVKLSDIGDSDLHDLAEASPDRDTKSIIESYISYREKAKIRNS